MPTIASLLRASRPWNAGAWYQPSIEEWLYSFLSSNDRVAAIVGTRIYEEAVPQSAQYPAITYSVIGGDRMYSMADTNQQVVNRLQVSVWSTSGVGRRKLADAVTFAMDGYRGQWGHKTIQSCFVLEDGINVYEPAAGAEPLRLFGKHIDFEVTHLVHAPTRME